MSTLRCKGVQLADLRKASRSVGMGYNGTSVLRCLETHP
jgi:hypothetical protein